MRDLQSTSRSDTTAPGYVWELDGPPLERFPALFNSLNPRTTFSAMRSHRGSSNGKTSLSTGPTRASTAAAPAEAQRVALRRGVLGVGARGT